MDSSHSAMLKAKQMRPLRSAYVYPDDKCNYNFEEEAPLAHPLEYPQHNHAGSARIFTCFLCPRLQGVVGSE